MDWHTDPILHFGVENVHFTKAKALFANEIGRFSRWRSMQKLVVLGS